MTEEEVAGEEPAEAKESKAEAKAPSTKAEPKAAGKKVNSVSGFEW